MKTIKKALPFNTYSQALMAQYGEKVYKLPLNRPSDCPNRDGTLSVQGCHFCSELGTGFESHEAHIPVKDQLASNRLLITKKYKAQLFIAYFQNYTSTYRDFESFKMDLLEAIEPDIVGISLSTRPDTLKDAHLNFLKDISQRYNLAIEFEMGLQTANDMTLKRINRGHDVTSFKEAVSRIHGYGFTVCAHVILNLPDETRQDCLNTVTLLNQLKVASVKLHSLYIAKGTVFETLYRSGELTICSQDEYLERVMLFIAHAHPDMVFQRLFARAPKEQAIFCNWATSWRKLYDLLLERMETKGIQQGMAYHHEVLNHEIK